MKIHYISIGLVLVFLLGCNKQAYPPPNTGKYALKPNPQPKYFLTIKGSIDSSLTQKVQLEIRSTFESTNPKCKIGPASIWASDADPISREQIEYTTIPFNNSVF